MFTLYHIDSVYVMYIQNVRTSLHMAVLTGRLDIIKLLLAKEADVTCKDKVKRCIGCTL